MHRLAVSGALGGCLDLSRHLAIVSLAVDAVLVPFPQQTTMLRISALTLFTASATSVVLGYDLTPAWVMRCHGACNWANEHGVGQQTDCGERVPGFTPLVAFQGGEKDFTSGCMNLEADGNSGEWGPAVRANSHHAEVFPPCSWL
jgi:hypothetical protein